MTRERGCRQQSFTEAAPNKLELGEGGLSGQRWPSVWRWLRGGRREREASLTTRLAFAP